MLNINIGLSALDMLPSLEKMWQLSARKIHATEQCWDAAEGTPVFTARGRWVSCGQSGWTRGFQYGSSLLQYDATGEQEFLADALENTRGRIAPDQPHTGMHDHGFNTVSTFGNLLRLWHDNRLPANLGGTPGDRLFFELALKVSGATQAARWTELSGNSGYIHSFNGPHSLFACTIRSLRTLALSHLLGHMSSDGQNKRINLLERLLRHGETIACYNVYFGNKRDSYDIRGRVAQESIFDLSNGCYRCPSSQQGYSPFSTWTRGLAWIMLGFTEQLDFLEMLPTAQYKNILAADLTDKKEFCRRFLEVARATADFYLDNCPTDGVPYWDTGAPGLTKMGDYLSRQSDPYNENEPVDSSAAVIAAQALLRLGQYISSKGDPGQGGKYIAAGLTVASSLLDEPYLSTDENHHGLLLHSLYNRPGGWDHVPDGSVIPCGESSMWGDYHFRELALLIRRMAINGPAYRFYPEQAVRKN